MTASPAPFFTIAPFTQSTWGHSREKSCAFCGSCSRVAALDRYAALSIKAEKFFALSGAR